MPHNNSLRGNTHRLRKIGALAAASVLIFGCERSPNPTDIDSGRESDTTALAADEHPPCDTQPPVRLDLEVWRHALGAEKPDAITARDQLLAQARLRAMPEAPGELFVEIIEARLGEAGTRDKIVQARYTGPDGTEALRVAILRPVPKHEDTYCVLGGKLSHDKEPGEEPCITDYTGPARRLSLTQIIAADRDAVVVHDAGGWCGSGSDQGDKFTVEYWGDEGGLVRYFKAVTYEAWYTAPLPPARELTGGIEWTGDWPKTLVHTETVTCDFDLELPSSGCVPAESVTTYHYRKGRYVPERGDH